MPHDYYNFFDKQANSLETGLDTELGSASSRVLADSCGRLQSLINLAPVVVKNNLKNPYDQTKYIRLPKGVSRYQLQESDEKGNLYKSLADAMYDKDPENLSDTKLYLGGASILDRLKRVWKNRRTTLLAKLVGTGLTPLESFSSNLLRADHYDPLSDSVALYSDNPAVLTHELGHAIDFNKLRNPAKDPEATSRLAKVWRAIKNEIKSTPRDLYAFQKAFMGRIAPFTTLYQETAANKRSLDNINKLKEEHPELVDAIKKLRTKQLPAAWSTYALGGTGVLTGLPTLLTAGGIRAATSVVDKESFDDLYSKLKDALKEYKKKRKEGLDNLDTGDVLDNPDKYDGRTMEYVVNRAIQRSEEEYDSKRLAAQEEYAKGNKDKAKELMMESLSPTDRKYFEYFKAHPA